MCLARRNGLLLMLLPALAVACSSSSSSPGGATDGGAGTGGTSGTGGTRGTGGASPDGGTGFSLPAHTTKPPANLGAGSVIFSASGEELAFTGYAFPPATDGDPAFVDGWEVKFDRLLVTIDKIKISDAPNTDKNDQSKTGALLAEADGPWAVDLVPQGPLMGKGGGNETAVPIAYLSNQNKNGNKAFDTTSGTRYAFGFDVAAATASAQNVNLDATALADFQQMLQDGCAVLYVGTATFKADPTTCTPASPALDAIPNHTVKFRLCFKSPTTYVNCQDGSDTTTPPINMMEEHARGFAFTSNAAVTAQVTIHTDHPFWDSLEHDAPAHFDQFAARAVGQTGTAMISLDDEKGVDYTAFTDKGGTKLPFRTCLPTSKWKMSGEDPPAPVDQMHFDPLTIEKIAATADPKTGFRDYYDYATYNQSTQGHLNSDGLCAVQHNYPSP